MAIVVISDTPDMTAAQHDQVAAELGLHDALPPGCLSFIAGMGPDGSTWRDLMVWERAAQAKEYMDTKLRPAIDRSGAAAVWGPPVNWDAHDESGHQGSRVPVHGQISYLQIPAVDTTQSATFFGLVFGWQVDPPQAGFEAPGLIGQWVADRQAAPDAGLMPWIQVDDIPATLELVRANGGTVLAPPSPDGPRTLATVRDPGGNAIGIVQLGPLAR
jgi:predicted enzyme related to lactoylglutathione lyase